VVTGVDVDVELVDGDDVLEVEVVVVSGGSDVVVVEVLVVETLVVEVLVVGSDGGGGRGGSSKSPRSGKASWEQSSGSPVRPSTKAQ
jgi:hypothetical protein